MSKNKEQKKAEAKAAKAAAASVETNSDVTNPSGVNGVDNGVKTEGESGEKLPLKDLDADKNPIKTAGAIDTSGAKQDKKANSKTKEYVFISGKHTDAFDNKYGEGDKIQLTEEQAAKLVNKIKLVGEDTVIVGQAENAALKNENAALKEELAKLKKAGK